MNLLYDFPALSYLLPKEDPNDVITVAMLLFIGVAFKTI